MTELTRNQIFDALQNGWGTYVEQFRRLSPEGQADFLEKQGFARLADLLAHVIAWWEEGQRVIEKLHYDPDFNSPDYDVDSFNAQAVERSRHLDEAATIQSFERTRQAWFDLVNRLPTATFQNKKIVDRLHIEVIGHLEEHRLP
jgi:hypothetical protein